MGNNKLSLKLLVDPKANMVVYAEAGKDFVDFLFLILALPVGTVVQLLEVEHKAGSLGKLYKSIKSMDGDYLQPNFNKHSVLKPRAAISIPLLSIEHKPSTSKFYRCPRDTHVNHVATEEGALCPRCHGKMSTEMNYIAPKSSQAVTTASSSRSGGCVKEGATYMVTDSLEVEPLSFISCFDLMKKLHVNFNSLEKTKVQVTFSEGIAILKASLQTKAVLTTAFLEKKKK